MLGGAFRERVERGHPGRSLPRCGLEARAPRNNKGAPMPWGALVGWALVSLEKELQSKLDLTRIRAGEAR